MKLKRGFIKSTFYLLLAISHFISVHAVEEGSYDKVEQFIMGDNRLVPNIQLAQSYIDVSDIIPASIDITPPSIDITTLSVEPKEAQPGNQVKISAKIEDLSGVAAVQVVYKIPITNEEKDIFLEHQGNNLYEGVFEVDEFTPNGAWQIKCIGLSDNQSNFILIYNQNLGYDRENEEDLGGGDFTVAVIDTTSPVITLNGDSSITIELGTNYEELGAKATDSVDGELEVTIDGEVNTKVLGTYIVTYTATDSSGNVSQIERKVTVVYAKEDLNEDGIINELDLDLLSSMYGLTTSDADFKEKYDLNEDGIIDLYDLVLISSKIQS